MDDKDATIRATPSDATKLAVAAASMGAFNIKVAKFLLADPFGVGVEDLVFELKFIRDVGARAIHAIGPALDAEVPDLHPVAQAAIDTSGGALFLALRCGQLLRRAGVGPEAEVKRLEVAVNRVIMTVLGDRLRDREIEKIREEENDWGEALLAPRMEGILLGQAWVLKRLIERRWGELPAWAGERLGKASREELERWTDRVLEAEGVEEVFEAG